MKIANIKFHVSYFKNQNIDLLMKALRQEGINVPANLEAHLKGSILQNDELLEKLPDSVSHE